jgi:hypothetical protein
VRGQEGLKKVIYAFRAVTQPVVWGLGLHPRFLDPDTQECKLWSEEYSHDLPALFRSSIDKSVSEITTIITTPKPPFLKSLPVDPYPLPVR